MGPTGTLSELGKAAGAGAEESYYPNPKRARLMGATASAAGVSHDLVIGLYSYP